MYVRLALLVSMNGMSSIYTTSTFKMYSACSFEMWYLLSELHGVTFQWLRSVMWEPGTFRILFLTGISGWYLKEWRCEGVFLSSASRCMRRSSTVLKVATLRSINKGSTSSEMKMSKKQWWMLTGRKGITGGQTCSSLLLSTIRLR